MAKRLNIGVDVDGVLANFTKGARNLCKELFNGKPLDHLVQTGWGFDSLGMAKEEENKMWRAIDTTPNWWMNLERNPNTSYLRHLTENARVIFITNRKDGMGLPIETQTSLWLAEKFQVLYPNVIISDNKGPVAAGLKLDYFIDDRPKNVEEVHSFYPQCKTFILDATYNQECKVVPRVQSFDEFAVIALPIPEVTQHGSLTCVSYERCVI